MVPRLIERFVTRRSARTVLTLIVNPAAEYQKTLAVPGSSAIRDNAEHV